MSDRSTLFPPSARRKSNLSGKVRTLLPSWNDESRLKPVGVASGLAHEGFVLHGSLKSIHTGFPLESVTTGVPDLLASRNATNPALLNHFSTLLPLIATS